MSNTYRVGQRVVIACNNDPTDDPDILNAIGQKAIVLDVGAAPDEYIVGIPRQAEAGEFVCTADELKPRR